MKNHSSTGRVALGLALGLACAPAWCGDIVQVVQAGTKNTFAIEQIASHGNNLIRLQQGGEVDFTAENHARLEQRAVGNSVIDALQGWHQNALNVVQHDGSDLEVHIQGGIRSPGSFTDDSTVTVDQSGYQSRVLINPDGWNQLAEVTQHGIGNHAEIHQFDYNNHASIAQAGIGLSATILQGDGMFTSTSGNRASIRQGY